MPNIFCRSLGDKAFAVISALLISGSTCLNSAAIAHSIASGSSNVGGTQNMAASHVKGSSGSGAPALSMDLSSSSASLTVSSSLLSKLSAVSLNIGGVQTLFGAGAAVTPAEYASIAQFVATGSQGLLINSSGQAVGGAFSLATLGTHQLALLIVPQNVTAVDPASRTPLTVSGLLSASGNILGLTSGSAHTLQLDANNVSVSAGGEITTGGNKPLNLSIDSLSDISNSGSITSSGTLSLSAAGGISNSLTQGGAAPLISGAQAVYLYAGNGNFANSGLITSTSGNVTFDTASSSNLALNNGGGQVVANSGAINFRNPQFSGTQLTNVTGGTLQAQALNFYGGKGAINVNAGTINGVVNVSGCTAHVVADGGTLSMGSMNLTGDPTIVNEAGDVILSQNLSFPGTALAILASGNISALPSVTSINLSSTSVPGGNLQILAGFQITSTPSSSTQEGPPQTDGITYTVGPSTSTNGGEVDLANVQINTSSTGKLSTANGGTIVVVVASGSTGTGAVNFGSINTSSKAGAGGVFFSGGDGDLAVNGGINTQGLTAGGNVDLSSGTFVFTSGPQYLDGVETVQGQGSSSAPAAGTKVTIGNKLLMNGTIQTGAVGSKTTPGTAGSVTIFSDAAVKINGSIEAKGSGTGGAVDLEAGNGFLVVRGEVNSSSTKGSGNSITLVGNDPGTVGQGQGIDIQDNVNSSGATSGGAVTATSSFGQINIGFNLSDGTPVLYSNNGGILANGTALTSSGGVVQLTASIGNVLVAKGINTSVPHFGGAGTITVDGGELVRIDGNVNANSFGSGQGANVDIEGGSGPVGIGVEIHGSISTIGVGIAGTVTLKGGLGSVLVTGSIATNDLLPAGNGGGEIAITADKDITIQNNISALAGGGVSVVSNSGYVSITGTIATSGANDSSVTITGQTGVSITGSILSGGSLFGTQYINGDVDVESGDGPLFIGGSVNTSGISSEGVAAPAGNITLNNGTGSYIQVLGNLIADGGAGNTGAINGDNGGKILVETMLNNFGASPIAARVGTIYIKGYVDARGGSTVIATGTGGAGGTVDLEGGTVQILGSNKGASISASSGVSSTGAFTGTLGTIKVETFGTQSVPSNFNLQSTALSVPALPGALFDIGVATVNGTAGAIVVGTQVALKTPVLGSLTTFTNITLSTNLSTLPQQQQIDVGGQTLPVNVLLNTGLPLTLTSPRQLVTPAEALALFQNTRSAGSQTIGLTMSGAADAVDINGSSPNVISIPGYEMAQPFSAFNFQVANTNFGSMTINVVLTDANPSVHMSTVAKSTLPFDIAGTLNFQETGTAPKVARMDFNSSLLDIIGGSITADNSTELDMFGSGKAVWDVLGTISAGVINMTVPSGSLTLGIAGVLQGSGGVAPLDISVGEGTKYVGALSIQNLPGSTSTSPSFENLLVSLNAGTINVGTFSKTLNQNQGPLFDTTAPIAQILADGPVSILTGGALALQNMAPSGANGAIFISADNGLSISGASLYSTATISFSSSTANVAFAGTNTLQAMNGIGVTATFGQISAIAGSTNIFQSGSHILNFTGGSGIDFSDGTNQFTSGLAFSSNNLVNPNGTINKSDIAAIGSIAFVSGGALTLSANNSFNAIGGNVSLVAIGAISLGQASSFVSQGGNVSILAVGSVTGGASTTTAAGNTFSATELSSGTGGGVEIISGSPTSRIATILKSRTSPITLQIGPDATGVTLNDLAMGGSTKGFISLEGQGTHSVTFTDTHQTSEVNYDNGAVLIESTSGSASVTLDGVQVTSIAPIAYRNDLPTCDDQVVDTGDGENTAVDGDDLVAEQN